MNIQILLLLCILGLWKQALASEVIADGICVPASNPDVHSSLEQTSITEEVLSIQKSAKEFLANPFRDGRKKRNSACPMMATSNETLLQRLNSVYSGLKDSKCANRNKEVMDSFGGAIKEVDNFFIKKTDTEKNYAQLQAGSTTNVDPSVVVASSADAGAATTINGTQILSLPTQENYQNQGMIIQTQQALNILSNIATNEQCAYDIRERGLIPVIADMVTNFSQLSMLASTPNLLAGQPLGNPYGIMVAAGGTAVGSVMKILYNLFKPKFNWEKFEDRKQFVDLVCSFYNTRMELDNMQFFRTKTKEDLIQYDTAKKIEERIEKKLQELDDLQQLQIGRAMGVNPGDGGGRHLVLLSDLAAVIKELTLPAFGEKVEGDIRPEVGAAYARFRQVVPRNIAKVKDILQRFDLDASAHPFLDLDADRNFLLSETLIPSLRGKSEKEISRTLLTPLLEIQAVLEDEKIVAEKTKIPAAIYKASTELTKLKKEIAENLEILGRLIEHQNYVASDEGSFIRQSIIDSYDKTQKIIFGDVGEAFLTYIKEMVMDAEYNFIKSYQKFYSNNMDPTQNASRDRSTIITICSSANDLLRKFSNAEALLNLATDFIDTNRDLFHDNTPHHSTFFMMPTGRSAQTFILRQAESLTLQRERMADPNYPQLAQVNDYNNQKKIRHKLKWHIQKKMDLGKLMDILEANRSNAESVQNFIIENNCGKMLEP
ncbi:MAG: hypothetical protein HQK53_15675 [Oligoflexia bacterium]|nr:hypothetical protein [Oligoflexia bacterium]